MNRFIKIIFMLIMSIFIVCIYDNIAYGIENLPDLNTMITEFDKNKNSSGLKKTYETRLSQERIYCNARGLGMNGISGNYEIQDAIKIDKDGVTYVGFERGTEYQSTISWDSMYLDQRKSAAELFYILNADDKYGTNYYSYSASSNHQMANVECVEEGEESRFWDNVSERQYALWMKIGDFCDAFDMIQARSTDHNTKGEKRTDCELLNKCQNYNYDNIKKQNKAVYIWFLVATEQLKIYKRESKSDLNGIKDVKKNERYYIKDTDTYYKYDKNRWVECEVPITQDFIYAGRKTTSNPPVVNPPVDKPIYGSITVKKRDLNDKNNTTALDGAEFALAKLENGSYRYKKMGKISGGKVTFSNLDEGDYWVFEWSTLNGYSLNAQDIKINGTSKNAKDGFGFIDGNNEVFARPLCYEVSISKNNSNNNFSVTVYNKKNNRITVIKKDSQTKKVIPGINFDLLKLDDAYKGKTEKELRNLDWNSLSKHCARIATGCTDKNGKIVFEDLDYGSYIIRETNNEDRTGNYKYSSKGQTKGYSMNIGYIEKVTISANEPNYSITIENRGYGGLRIQKKDADTNNKLSNVTFGLYIYVGNGFKLVNCVQKNGAMSQKLTTGTNGEAKTVMDRTKWGITIEDNQYCIPNGTYYLFEIANNNKGYDVKFQGKEIPEGLVGKKGVTYIENVGSYMGEIKIETGQMTNLTDDKSITNRKYGTIKIIKNGQDNKTNLSGAEFRIIGTTNKGTQLDRVIDKDDWNSKDKMYVKEKIPYGNYTIYEITAPQGYEIAIQEGYTVKEFKRGNETIKENRVKLGTIKIADDITQSVTCSLKRIKLDNGNDVLPMYKKSYSNASNGKGPVQEVIITNRKWINISGYVWEDVPNSKNNIYNDRYDGYSKGVEAYKDENGNATIDASSSYEQIITKNIKITLKYRVQKNYDKNKDKSIQEISQKDIANGVYTFKKVDASQLANYYIEFDYSAYNESNNSKKDNQYITCIPYLAITNGSKALINEEDLCLKDEDLIEKANTGKYLGEILNNKNRRETFYSENNGKDPIINNVNLGIKRIPDTDFEISNNLDSVIVSVNGYTFTYKYGEKGVTTDSDIPDSLPKVNWQSKTDKYAYTRSIYPSDIYTLDSEDCDEKIKIEVVYKISITNTTKYNIKYLYQEVNLQLDNNGAEDIFDPYRYEVESDWSGGYTSNSQRHGYLNQKKYGNPIKNYKDFYIRFTVKDDAVKDILEGETYEKFPTKARIKAYHNYKRVDYYWVWKNGYATPTSSEVNHQTVTKTHEEEAPYLKLTKSEDRTISGKVFEDIKTQDYESTKEPLGNGVVDNNEKKVSNVKVELGIYNGEDFTPTKLYPFYGENGVMKAYETEEVNGADGKKVEKFKKDQNNKLILKSNLDNHFDKAETKTSEDGTYSFSGVLPGEYYVRFTYGDGTQEIIDGTKRTKVYSNDYKSTIIDSNIAKIIDNAYNSILNKGGYRWYLNEELNKKERNLATDELTDSPFEYTQSVDFTTTNIDIKGEVKASTPKISVPIEFYEKNSANATDEVTNYSNPKFGNMNFGIIEKPKLRVNIKKNISNVKLTLQNGQVLIDGNPTQNIPYVANLDTEWNKIGSHYAKVEIDNQYMYGSILEIEYTLTITNNSDITYADESYYKYGNYFMAEKTEEEKKAKEAKVNIQELLEYLDPSLSWVLNGNDTKYEKKVINTILEQTYTNSLNILKNKIKDRIEDSGKTIYDNYFNEIYSLNPNINEKEQYKNGTGDIYLYTNIKEENRTDSSTTVKVKAARILSTQDDNLDYESYAQVAKANIAHNTYSDPTGADSSATIAFEQIPYDSSKVLVSPSTGLERNKKYIISGIILCISTISIIICIKIIRKKNKY